MNFRLHYSRGT